LRGWKPKECGWAVETTWRYEELSAALLWHLSPWEFDARPQSEKAEMIGMRIAQATVENWQYEAAERAAKLNSGK